MTRPRRARAAARPAPSPWLALAAATAALMAVLAAMPAHAQLGTAPGSGSNTPSGLPMTPMLGGNTTGAGTGAVASGAGPQADDGKQSSTGQPLSGRATGVITPPAVDPAMPTARPPAMSSTMPVIPPPGSPGGNPAVAPK